MRKVATITALILLTIELLYIRRFNGGEGGIRTPETLSSLHAFQACALSRARPPLRARTAIMHHTRWRGQFVRSDMPRCADENAQAPESAAPGFSRTRPIAAAAPRRPRT